MAFQPLGALALPPPNPIAMKLPGSGSIRTKAVFGHCEEGWTVTSSTPFPPPVASRFDPHGLARASRSGPHDPTVPASLFLLLSIRAASFVLLVVEPEELETPLARRGADSSSNRHVVLHRLAPPHLGHMTTFAPQDRAVRTASCTIRIPFPPGSCFGRPLPRPFFSHHLVGHREGPSTSVGPSLPPQPAAR